MRSTLENPDDVQVWQERKGRDERFKIAFELNSEPAITPSISEGTHSGYSH